MHTYIYTHTYTLTHNAREECFAPILIVLNFAFVVLSFFYIKIAHTYIHYLHTYIQVKQTPLAYIHVALSSGLKGLASA